MAITMYAPTTTWNPEDDLLLKNSIEAGASLQALAKGAVQFSRGFTLRELRDRWHSILYDPHVSMEAASKINELDLSGSNSAASKISRSEIAKSAGVTAKRKIVSIRRQYNLKRKKLRTELFNSSDIGFLEPNLHDCNGHTGDIQDHLTLDNGQGGTNCMLRDSISDHFGLQDSDFDILHQVFQAGDVGTTTIVEDSGNGYQTQCPNIIGGNQCMSNAMEDNLFGLPENIPPLIGENGRGSFQTDIGDKTVSHMLADDSVNFGNFANSNTHDPLQELSNDKHLEADDSAMKRLPAFHPMTENPQSTSSGIAGRHINSPDSDGTITLHTMGFSSPMTRLPLWKTMEDISVPAMPVHMHNEEMTHGVEESLTLPGNKQRGKSLGFDAVHSDPLLIDRDDNGNFYSSGAASEGEFADLSDALLDFPAEDELFFMNVDGKDKTDKSSCDNTNSLIISSSGDAQEGGICDTELTKSNNIEPCTTYVSTACHGVSSSCAMESKNIISSLHDDGQQSITPSEINIASKFMLHPDSSQFNEENICCTLNTEDTEIPCNDDIFLLIHPTSFTPARKLYTTDPIDPVSSADEKDNDRGINLTKAKDSALSHAWSVGIGPKKLPDSFPSLPIAGSKVKSEVLDPKNFNLQPGEVSKTIRELSQNRSAVSTSSLTADGMMEQDVMKVEPRVLNNQGTTSREIDLIAEAGPVKTALPVSFDNPSASDEESESENDVPYFSDVEAMILEMDLGPQDQYLHSTRKVLKYQNDDAKKRIIRLEQCARSSLQRMMSSHGAFAFLYGRHLKHYINKTEVLLGRSTDDVNVDIDLRKEGRANKISRRQATIKMEANGSFFLKNLGKSSLSINGKEVASEQSVRLGSGSLIEIKGMSFVFEINQKYVSRHLDTVIKKNQYNGNKFGRSLGHKI